MSHHPPGPVPPAARAVLVAHGLAEAVGLVRPDSTAVAGHCGSVDRAGDDGQRVAARWSWRWSSSRSSCPVCRVRCRDNGRVDGAGDGRGVERWVGDDRRRRRALLVARHGDEGDRGEEYPTRAHPGPPVADAAHDCAASSSRRRRAARGIGELGVERVVDGGPVGRLVAPSRVRHVRRSVGGRGARCGSTTAAPAAGRRRGRGRRARPSCGPIDDRGRRARRAGTRRTSWRDGRPRRPDRAPRPAHRSRRWRRR